MPIRPGTPPKIIITGANGFVAPHLKQALREIWPDAQIYGLDRSGGADGILKCDLTDGSATIACVRELTPDAIVHLAAISSNSEAQNSPEDAWTVNVMGTLNVVRAIEVAAPEAHLLFASSSEVYGLSAAGGTPVREDAVLQPTSVYGATKAAADIMVQEAARRSIHATIVRPFNHTGPGQTPRFVVPAFATQIARIEAGLQEPALKTGTLTDARDFLDVRDVVRAYAEILRIGQRLRSGLVLNVASGVAHRISDLLAILLRESSANITVQEQFSLVRRSNTPLVVGDTRIIQETLAWRPKFLIEETLKSVLDHARMSMARRA